MNIPRLKESRKSVIESLTARELEVLLKLAHGKSRRSISEQLGISILTYDEHRKKIKIKLGLNTQADWASILIMFKDVRLNQILNENK